MFLSSFSSDSISCSISASDTSFAADGDAVQINMIQPPIALYLAKLTFPGISPELEARCVANL
jgi:hypothetical protein